MTVSQETQVHSVAPDQGVVADLGIVQMRLLAGSQQTGGAFALGEFKGSPGPWTVWHVHRTTEESFYVMKGSFVFHIGDEIIEAGPGTYLFVPRGTPHVFEGGPEGGTLLCLWVPGGLENMFIELAGLPGDAILNPEARARVSAKYDSVPVQRSM